MIWAGAASAQVTTPGHGEPIELQLSPTLKPSSSGRGLNNSPITLRADSLSGVPDLDATAEGDVELRQGGTVIRADRLRYQQPEDLATATGNVQIKRDGNVYSGPQLQLKIQRFQGYFLNPTYYFSKTQAGGTASRIDFLDDQRDVLTNATYTSCLANGSGSPAWLLSTSKISLDFGTNTGVAEGAVLRFYDVPIFAAPSFSFPLNDDRKSGWLPPTFGLDSRNGAEFSIPYYWNIAPGRDATFTPEVRTRRGASFESEFRYLEPSFNGAAKLDLLPHDAVTGAARYALNLQHDSYFNDGALFNLRVERVSDDDYWIDFPSQITSLTPRLLASSLGGSKPLGDNWTTYARVETWQVLQSNEADGRIEAPYQREPQIGARYAATVGRGFDVGFETEFNRFTNPGEASLNPRIEGNRVDVLASLAWPYRTPGWTLTPRVSVNTASYSVDRPFGSVDPAGNGSRVIPTFSLDSAWVFERDAAIFGRAVQQTLEPRFRYVNTPYRDQSGLPNFDAYQKDLNYDSIYTDNDFSGVDRVSDANQLTAGLTTRFIDGQSGAEALRLGVAQRYLFRDQRTTPDGQPLTRRFSDVLLFGSTTLIPSWSLDSSVQYSPENTNVTRSLVSARYSPGPYRTVSATYRSTRGLSEQVELAWQWPIYGPTPDESGAGRNNARQAAGSAGGNCGGSWYGVGRINYSTLERRLVDAIVGVEYDAGCWIGRLVAARQSTGFSQATTRLLFQLELVGLSRVGSNPLQVLKNNVPGYRLLRNPGAASTSANVYE